LEIILIGSVSDLNVIPQTILDDKNIKKYSFDFDTHQKLESKNIPHEMADNLLTRQERLKLFDTMSEFLSWHSKLPSDEYTFENVNLLKLIDSTGFYMTFMPKLINFALVKRILEKEIPLKIFSSTMFSKMIQSINNNIETHFFQNSYNQNFLWDTIPIKYNIGKRNFSFNLSKKKYLKIKNFIESTLCCLFNLGFNFKNIKKKNLIFLEFNVSAFSNLFNELKNFDGNIILINQRRPAIWNKNSFNIIHHSNCKILQLEKILSKKEQNKISISHKKFLKNIDKLWDNTEFFSKLFQYENMSFWHVIKEELTQIYSNKLFDNMKLITSIKNFYDDVDISCIISLNEVGETEKAFLEFNNNQNHSILLEHGFNDKNDSVPETKPYDVLSNYYKFKDKIAVWDEKKKKYLIDNYGLDPKRIIVSGSPRHDDYFTSRKQKKNNKEKIILVAPNPITETYGLSSTELKLRFNDVIQKIISIIEKFDDIKLVVKLHAFPSKHNEEIKLLINEIDENIPIYLSHSVIDLVNSSDIVMVISPLFGTTTMLLESMILGKPTMNIYFEDKIPEFNHVKHNAVFSMLDNCNMEYNLKKIIYDETFQKELINNADEFISKYLNIKGNSSEKFAKILNSY